MKLSSQTEYLIRTFGYETAVRMMCEAGYDCIDFTFANTPFRIDGEFRETARMMKNLAAGYGVEFNQAHAPFGGGYDNYVQNLVPTFPEVFEAAAILGVKQIIVHPLQRGRYYGREKLLFDMNMEFYRSLAPLAREYGVKIAIENMWQSNPIGRYIVDDVCANPHELAAYYDTLDNPDCFTVCLDLGHVALCNREPEDAIRIIGHDRLGALHVHDVDYRNDLHTLPGCGKINWGNVTKALAEIDYKGEFTYEADNFFVGFEPEFAGEATEFMVRRGKHLISMIEKQK